MRGELIPDNGGERKRGVVTSIGMNVAGIAGVLSSDGVYETNDGDDIMP